MSELSDPSAPQAQAQPFYVTGGTIPPDSPSYARRAADHELLAALVRGELCYVLNARQMGKSSLSVRTRQALEAAGTRTAFLDLQKFGSSASAEQWYRALLERIGSDLKLRAPFLTYWRENAELPPLARLFGALREVALEQIPGHIVLFLDEIDVVRDLGFKTDEFFGAIRESHNARVTDPALSRLTFCLIGTVAPTDLIRDVRLSPFNIGTRVKLADFTPAEAAPLSGPLPGGAKTLDRVLWWTSGHPYLTQRLCAELSRASSVDVDAMVSRLFLAKSDTDVDENIKNVRNTMLRMGGEGTGFDRTDLLTRYGQIVSGKRVADDDTDGVCTALRLSGLVTSVDGLLRVRNRVYAKLFDALWVRDNLPDAEVRRQRAAVARARWQIGSIAALIFIVMGSLTAWAVRSAHRADANASIANAEKAKALAAQSAAQDQTRKALIANGKEQAATVRAQRSATAAVIALRHEADAKTAAQAALKEESAAKATALASEARAKEFAIQKEQEAARADREATASRRQAAATNHLAYIATINMISRQIDNYNYDIAEKLFSDAERFPKSERGAEWYLLKDRLHPELLAIKCPTKSDGFVLENYSVFSPSGDRVIFVSGQFFSRQVVVCDSLTRRKLLSLDFDQRGNGYRVRAITAVAFSADGTKIITGEQDDSLDLKLGHLPEGVSHGRIWDSRTGQQLAVLQLAKQNTGEKHIGDIAFSPDGKRVVAALEDNQTNGIFEGKRSNSFTAWDNKTNAPRKYDAAACVWDAESGQQLLSLDGHTDDVMAVAFSTDGKKIVTGSRDCTVRIWDAVSGATLNILKEQTSPVTCVVFSNNGRWVLSGSYDGTTRIWNTTTGKEIWKLERRNRVNAVAFSSDDERIIIGNANRTAGVWNPWMGEELLMLSGHAGGVTSVAFSPEGNRIFTGSYDGTARIWDARVNRESLGLTGHFADVKAIAFSKNGQQIVTGSDDGSARIWDVATGRQKFELRGKADHVTSVTYSPDGKIAMAGFGHSYIQSSNQTSSNSASTSALLPAATLWDADNGKEISSFIRVKPSESDEEDRGFSSNLPNTRAVGFSPNGKRAVTVNDDQVATIWDPTNGHQLMTVSDEKFTDYHSVAFSSDGTHIILGYDGHAEIRDSATGHLTKDLLRDHNGYSVFVSPDGTRIISSENSCPTDVWDAITGKHLVSLTGYDDSVQFAAFSPDGKRIITGSGMTMHIWDVATGREMMKFTPFVNQISAVAFSPDSSFFVTAHEYVNRGKPNVIVWRRVTDKQAAEADPVNHAIEAIQDLTNVPPSRLSDALNWVTGLMILADDKPQLRRMFADKLNNIAKTFLSSPNQIPIEPNIILNCAMDAYTYSNFIDVDIMDTLASAYNLTGNVRKAIEIEKRAVTLAPANKDRIAVLKRYEALAAARGTKPN